MALQQAAGTTLGVSATLPATVDAAGFGALTFIAVGKLGNAPDLDGTFDIASFDSLSDGAEFKLSDIFRAGSGTVQVAFDEADTGQTALETAAATGATVAIEVTLRSGTIYYRQAIITSFMPTELNVGSVVRADVGMEFTDRTVKV